MYLLLVLKGQKTKTGLTRLEGREASFPFFLTHACLWACGSQRTTGCHPQGPFPPPVRQGLPLAESSPMRLDWLPSSPPLSMRFPGLGIIHTVVHHIKHLELRSSFSQGKYLLPEPWPQDKLSKGEGVRGEGEKEDLKSASHGTSWAVFLQGKHRRTPE